MRRGIIAGGNWIVDNVKTIDIWPQQDALATVVAEVSGNGGSPYNLLKDLRKMGAEFPLVGVGLIGNDSAGQQILADCEAHQIKSAGLYITDKAPTSYTDVMTEGTTGRRTFFHNRGANSLLGPEHFDFSGTTAKIFHLGYLLLLDRLDALEQGRPVAATVLERARSAGLHVSLDCVSETSDRFTSVVAPVLPLVDVLFANDFEAEKLTGLSVRKEGRLCRQGVEAAAGRLLSLGVRCWSVIHFPEGACAVGPEGRIVWQPSVQMPPNAIAGTAGAGDAFAAGVLLGIHEAWPIERSLALGVCAAASSLKHVTCSEAIVHWETCLQLGNHFSWRKLPS